MASSISPSAFRRRYPYAPLSTSRCRSRLRVWIKIRAPSITYPGAWKKFKYHEQALPSTADMEKTAEIFHQGSSFFAVCSKSHILQRQKGLTYLLTATTQTHGLNLSTSSRHHDLSWCALCSSTYDSQVVSGEIVRISSLTLHRIKQIFDDCKDQA